MFFRCTLPSGKVLVRFNDYTHYFFPSNNFLGKRLRNQPHPNFILGWGFTISLLFAYNI